MPTLLNFMEIEDTTLGLAKMQPPILSFYFILILFVSLSTISLFYIKTDITIRTTGVTRPNTERTEVKPLITGLIQKINYREGDIIKKNATIAIIQNNNSESKKMLNDYEIGKKRQYIQDLELLTTLQNIDIEIFQQLQSPLYRQQISRFVHQITEQEAKLKKVSHELAMNDTLVKQGVVAAKDLFDKKIEYTQAQANQEVLKKEQLSIWEQSLSNYKLELSQLEAQKTQLLQEEKLYDIKAPTEGIIQGINNRYAGGVIQMGEAFCIISPETELIAECYISTQDVGLIKQNQFVKYQIDAFDYKYFGVLNGKVLAIDNDFTVVNNKPIFKVRCSFDKTNLSLKNGFTSHLKKGLTFQARFVITERTLWQLLWDKIDNWLNPSAPFLNS